MLLQIHIKNKIAQTDKQLKELQDQVRQTKTSEIPKNVGKKETKKTGATKADEYKATKQKSQETLKHLEVLQL